MSGGDAWQGNIKARLYERGRERDDDSLTERADASPAVPMYALADGLGNDAAAARVLSDLLAETNQRGETEGCRGLQRHRMASLSMESFSWGRLDAVAPGGTLRPGAFASAGLGVDNAR